MRNDEAALITKDVVMNVMDMLRPFIKSMMEGCVLKRYDLHIVVLNPGMAHLIGNIDTDFDIMSAILYEESFGNKSKWEHKYDKIARGKAKVTLRTGLPSLYVIQQAPQLLLPGDPKFGGSAILDGIITAASGATSFQDQMVSEIAASMIKSRGIFRMQEALNDESSDFLE